MTLHHRIALFGVASFFPLVAFAEPFAFPDVPFVHPNAEAIEYLKAKGIISGYADGTFKPDTTINRAEFVKIIVGAYPKQDELAFFFDLCTETPFSDVDLNAWYGKYVCVASLGDYPTITGYPDGTFKPDQTINFSEAAKILSRSFELTNATSEEMWYRPAIEVLYRKHAIPTNIHALDQRITRGDMAEMIARLHEQDETKETVSSATMSQWLGMKVFTDAESPLTFFSSLQWGDVIKSDNPYRTQFAYAYEFSGLKNTYNAVEINLLAYDDAEKRYVEECPDLCTEGSENIQVDLLEQRSSVELLSNIEIAGKRGNVSDGYSPEGGNIYKRYVFFTDSYRVEIVARYDIVDLYIDSLGGSSLTEAVMRDLHGSTFGTVGKMLYAHPNAREMHTFFDDLDAFVLSIKNRGESTIDAEAQKRNAQRQYDVRHLLEAIHQFSIAHYTSNTPHPYPAGLNTQKSLTPFAICKQGMTCNGISLDELITGIYIHDIPADPLSSGDTTGYSVTLNENGSLTIKSVHAEGGIIISETGW